jgi:hypothetical protein
MRAYASAYFDGVMKRSRHSSLRLRYHPEDQRTEEERQEARWILE